MLVTYRTQLEGVAGEESKISDRSREVQAVQKIQSQSG